MVPVFQGCLAVLGFPSSQQAQETLGLLYLLCGQGNLVPHSDHGCQVLQDGRGCPRSARLEVREGREGQEDHRVPGLPSVQGHQYVHQCQENLVLLVCRGSPCLPGVQENHSVLAIQVWHPRPRQGDP